MWRLLFLILLLSAPALAALPPMSEGDLQASAEIVIEGEVLSVTSTSKKVRRGSDRHYEIVVKATKIVKGEGDKDHPFTLFCRQTESRPTGWAGPQGQNDIPRQGERGRFYLSSGLKLLEPNGWTRIDQP